MSLFAGQLFDGIVTGAVYALLAISLNFTYNVTRIVQLAQGDILMVGAYIGFLVSRELPNLLAAIAAAMLACGMLGWFLYDSVFRWLQAKGHLPPLVAGIALSALIEELLRLTFYGGLPVHYPSAIISGTPNGPTYQLTVLGVAAAVAIGFHLLTSKTPLGRALRATADSEDGAQVVGISVQRIRRIGFSLGAALAGSAGVLVANVYQSLTPTQGLTLEFIAIACVLFGGLGSIPGAVVGALVIGVLQALVSTYVTSSYSNAVAFGVVLAVILLRPSGLLGAPRGERA